MNERKTSINDISNQFAFMELARNQDNSNNKTKKRHYRRRRNFLASEHEIQQMKELSAKGKTHYEIANILNIGRNFFYHTRNDPKHPQHRIMVEIFGEIKRINTFEPPTSISSVSDNSILETFNNLARCFVLEYIMTSDNSQINAQDLDVAKRYSRLKTALEEALRLEDKNDPMYIYSKALYNEITSQLIDVTRKIYDERQKQDESLKKP